MKVETRRFHKLLDSGKIPKDFRKKYSGGFLVSKLLDSIKSGIPPFLVAIRFKYKTWKDIEANWGELVSVANDSKTVGELFRLYCFEKIDRNSHMNVKFDEFVDHKTVKASIISQVDDVVTKYQNTWHTEVIFGLLAELVSDYDKKKRGGVHTPLVLVREIYSKIPNVWGDGKILDPACGNGVFLWEAKRLCMVNGIDEQTIVEDLIMGVDIDPKKAYITNAILDPDGLYESRIFIANSLDFLDRKVWKMKFDMIVGNPPFQDSNSDTNNKLYTMFIELSVKILKQGGFMSLISPISWMGYSDKKSKRTSMSDGSEYKELFRTLQVHWVDLNKTATYFDVGSSFSSYIIENTLSYKPTEIDGKKVSLTGVKFFPKSLSKTSLEIFNKTFYSLHPKMDVCQSAEKHATPFNKNEEKPLKEKTATHKYELFHTSSNDSSRWTDTPHTCQYVKKIIFSLSGYFKPFYDDGSLGVTHIGLWIPVNDNIQGEILISILKSKLYTFIIEQSKYSGFYLTKVLKMLPVVDFNKRWSDEELYKHFNLTKEEIDLIENIVK